MPKPVRITYRLTLGQPRQEDTIRLMWQIGVEGAATDWGRST